MFLAQLRCHAAGWIAGFLLITVNPAAMADEVTRAGTCTLPANTRTSSVRVEEPAWMTSLLDAMVASGERATSLTQALKQVPGSRSADPVVTRARLTLAALALQDGDADAARALLLTIPLDSEAALDGGLLVAESWALAGDLQTATRWNQRVAQRWPQEPAALDALVERGAALAGQDRAAALPVLIGAREQALKAIPDLDRLAARLEHDEWFSRWVAAGGEPALDPQAAAIFYRVIASEAFQSGRGAALATKQPAVCARLQAIRLIELQASIDTAAADARRLLVGLTSESADIRRRYLLVRDAYLSGGGHDVTLGRQVNQLRNALARSDAIVTSLESAMEALPVAGRELATEAGRLESLSKDVGERAAQDVVDALRAVITKRRAALLDIAGSASLHIGEIRDPRYSAR